LVPCGSRDSQQVRIVRFENLATVLLIDDNPIQLRAREGVLRSAGFQAHIATNAESALALMRTPAVTEQLGAIITDHVLNEESGVDFVRELRRLNRDIPVIVVTGSADAESDYHGLDIIFRQKPCPPEELIGLVKSLIR
jgi:DNA-binding response OmpR family regulator